MNRIPALASATIGRLRALVALVAMILVVAAPAAGAQESDQLEVTNIDTSGFPLVKATLTGPTLEGDLDDAFIVTEGEQVLTTDVIRLRADNLNVVVAIDVSGSMEGEPLTQAKAAVRELLANLPDAVPVSVVSFGANAVVTHDFSTDRDSIEAAVDDLIAAGGTALFDGLNRSMAQLSAEGGTGAVVVLADGGDSASTTPAADVVERLGTAGARFDFVTLQSPDLDVGQIQALADAAGGTVTTVEQAGGLADAFGQIAANLSGTYEVRWQSDSEGSSGTATIALASDPSTAVTTEFDHAEVRQFVPDVATDSRTVSGAGPFEASWIPLVGALAVSAGALLLLSMMRSSEGAVERRAERRAEKDQIKSERTRSRSGLQTKLEDMSAQVLERDGRDRSLDDTLDRAGIAMRSNEFVVVCLGATVASLFVGLLLFGFPFFALALIFPVAGIPLFLRFKINRRRKKFVDQLGDTLQLMAGSLTAGYGLGQTLDSVARETDAPTSEEFQRVVMETRLGRSLEESLEAMSQRIGAEDFNWVVDAIKIQASVGGNLSDIIQQVGETIRARVRIKRQVAALSAEGKISGFVLFVLPFGLFGFIYTSNPGYIQPMFSSGLGQVMLGSAVLMISVGGLWLKKLVTPDF